MAHIRAKGLAGGFDPKKNTDPDKDKKTAATTSTAASASTIVSTSQGADESKAIETLINEIRKYPDLYAKPQAAYKSLDAINKKLDEAKQIKKLSDNHEKDAQAFYIKLTGLIEGWEKQNNKKFDTQLLVDHVKTSEANTLALRLAQACFLYGCKYLSQHTSPAQQLAHSNQNLAFQLMQLGIDNLPPNSPNLNNIVNGIFNIKQQAKTGHIFKALDKLLNATNNPSIVVRNTMDTEIQKINGLTADIDESTASSINRLKIHGFKTDTTAFKIHAQAEGLKLRAKAPHNVQLIMHQRTALRYLLNTAFPNGDLNIDILKRILHTPLKEITSYDSEENVNVHKFPPPSDKTSFFIKREINRLRDLTFWGLLSEITTTSRVSNVASLFGVGTSFCSDLIKTLASFNIILKEPTPAEIVAATAATKDDAAKLIKESPNDVTSTATAAATTAAQSNAGDSLVTPGRRRSSS